MSTQITTAFVQQYASTVAMLVQQKGSRLRDAVRVESANGEFEYFDQVGAGAAVKRISRHADTPFTETPHARRQVALEDYEYNDFIDRQDRVRTLIDPTSPYAQAAAFAMGRVMDDVIIAATNGTSKTGKTGATPVVLPAGQKVAVAASGLTLAKLLSAKEILDGVENDPDEERYIGLAAKDVTSLLNTTEIKSADYNTVKALVAGQIDTFLGFKFIRSQRLGTVVGGSDRAVLAWRKTGLLLAVGQEPQARISERPDKGYTTQVYYSMSIGATRMEEEAVVEIAVTP
ncbi:MAG: phage capsid protein [Alphaproteobacteria bacterium]